jgi:hypothetical protein
MIPVDRGVYLVRDLRYPADDCQYEPARFIQSGGPRGSYWQFFGTDDDVYATEGVEIVARMIVAAGGVAPGPFADDAAVMPIVEQVIERRRELFDRLAEDD